MMRFLALVFLVGCGNMSTGNCATGQVKRLVHNTPLVCGTFWDVDISLGVMRNGVGSMSTHDELFYVGQDDTDKVLQTLQQANKTGEIVQVTYSEARWAPCWGEYTYITQAEIEP